MYLKFLSSSWAFDEGWATFFWELPWMCRDVNLLSQVLLTFTNRNIEGNGGASKNVQQVESCGILKGHHLLISGE